MRGTVRGLLLILIWASLGAGCVTPFGGGGDGGAAPEQATLAHREFVPAWQSGPANVTYEGRTVHVDENVTFATDGETWFYAVAGADPHAPEAVAECRDRADDGDIPDADPDVEWVLVDATRCMWSRHPAASCSGTHACEDAMGVPRKTAPPDPPPPTSAV